MVHRHSKGPDKTLRQEGGVLQTQIPRNTHAQADYVLKVQQGQHTCFAFLTRETHAKHLCFPLGHTEIAFRSKTGFLMNNYG